MKKYTNNATGKTFEAPNNVHTRRMVKNGSWSAAQELKIAPKVEDPQTQKGAL